MKARGPTASQIHWGFVGLQFFIMIGLITLSMALLNGNALLGLPYPLSAFALGAVLYLAWSNISKTLLFTEHRRGVRLTFENRHEEAIQAFQATDALLRRYPWIDRYRWLVALDPSAIAYREMALCNIAFNYAQMGDARRAKAAYEYALAEFPTSEMARNALRLIESVIEEYRAKRGMHDEA
jgi:tetratricopeptide (TPR) repeat protein